MCSVGVKTTAFLAEAAVFAYLGLDFVLVDFGALQWSFIALVVGACLVSRLFNIFPMGVPDSCPLCLEFMPCSVTCI